MWVLFYHSGVVIMGVPVSCRSRGRCRCLMKLGLERGCRSICWGLMHGDGFGPRLSRMSDDFWCPAGNCCQGNWFWRDSGFPELPITFWKLLPVGFMSRFQQAFLRRVPRSGKGIQNTDHGFVLWMPPSISRFHCLFFFCAALGNASVKLVSRT